MVSKTAGPTRVPRFVPFLNPLAVRLLGRGRLMGPNTLLTVRGRKTGEPRTTPVALVDTQGRRWVIGTFGETNWVRNLRAAGEATLSVGGQHEAVTAHELTREEAEGFFTGVLEPYVQRILIGGLLLRMLGARDILADPAAAAGTHPVFELAKKSP